MNLFQVVTLSLIALFTISRVYRWREEPFLKIIFNLRWVAIFLIAFVVIAFPQVSTFSASVFGIKRGADLVIYVSMIWLLYKIQSDSERIERLESNLEKISRKIALKDK
jgi:hypothetical protein